jgi:predicted metal-dependent hydrolase
MPSLEAVETSSPREPAKPASPPKVRFPDLALDAPLPRYWLADNVFATHLANGINLLFPAGERFFVRSVRRYVDDLDDPALLERVRAFFGQEGAHAREHERAFRQLEAQGLDPSRFLRLYEALAYGLIERVASDRLRLSTTAACEHFTAILAADALRNDVLDHAPAAMRELLRWHAAEEIEHRAVAFDVLQKVAPGYGLRIAGIALATACLGGFWTLATAMLLAQDREAGVARVLADWRKVRENDRERSVFVEGILDYLRPDFHPSQSDIDALAERYLSAVGLA